MVRLKLPYGWERGKDDDELFIRFPAIDIPEPVLNAIRDHFGELSDIAMERLYKLSQLQALNEAMR